MTKPKDDTTALDAAEAEATGAVVDDRSFTIAGETFTIPKKIKYFKLLRRMNAGDEFGAMEVLLGSEQMERLEELEMTDEDVETLNAEMSKVMGVEEGNSPSSQS